MTQEPPLRLTQTRQMLEVRWAKGREERQKRIVSLSQALARKVVSAIDEALSKADFDRLPFTIWVEHPAAAEADAAAVGKAAVDLVSVACEEAGFSVMMSHSTGEHKPSYSVRISLSEEAK